jgi:hypothetical protein
LLRIEKSAQKKTELGRREGRKRDIPALLLAISNKFFYTILLFTVCFLPGKNSISTSKIILPHFSKSGKKNLQKIRKFSLASQASSYSTVLFPVG